MPLWNIKFILLLLTQNVIVIGTIPLMEEMYVINQMEHATANLILILRTNAKLVKMAGSLITTIVLVRTSYFDFIYNL